jgi:hypothetical protein
VTANYPSRAIEELRDNGSAAPQESTEAAGGDEGVLADLPHLPEASQLLMATHAASPDRNEPITIRIEKRFIDPMIAKG